MPHEAKNAKSKAKTAKNSEASNRNTKQEANEVSGASTAKLDAHLVSRLWFYLKARFAMLVAIVILILLANLANVAHPYIVKIGIDDYVANDNYAGLKFIAMLLGISLLLNFLFSLSYNYLIQYLGHHLVKKIRLDIAKKALSLKRSYFDRTPLGQTLTLLTNDVESIREFIANGMASILANTITIAFLFGVMYFISPSLTALVALSVPLFAISTYLFKVALRSGYRGVRRANAGMNVQLVESITGMKEILLFNHREKSIADFNAVNKNYRNSFIKIVRSYSLYFPVIEGLTALTMIVIIFISYLYFANMPSFGNLFAFFIYINMLFRPLRDLAEQFNTLQSALSGAERIFKFLDRHNHRQLEFRPAEQFLASANPYKPHSLHTSHAQPPPPQPQAEFSSIAYNANKHANSQAGSQTSEAGDHSSQERGASPLEGSVEFRNVHFAYDKGSPVLQGLSFRINAGEKIAIVGSTGAGKSTVVSLITGLYTATSGEIFVGGIPIRDIPLRKLRQNISIIPQDVFLFSGSFRENILLAHPHAEEKLRAAADQALISDIIAQRSEGFASTVLEEGKSLSTGQKQLLAFARAFIKNAPIVILDEATANIDSESERKIETALQRITKGRTSIIIAHRLSTIRHADRILVLHHGQLLETGSHQQLLKKEGFYHKLYSMQQIQLEAG